MTRYVYNFSRDACVVALKVGGRRSMFMRLRQNDRIHQDVGHSNRRRTSISKPK